MFGECASFLLAFILYLHDLHKHNRKDGAPGVHLTGALCRIALPVAVSAYFRSGLVTAEHMAIPWGLRQFGSSPDAALATYGVIQGMVLPVVLYPSAFLNAFSSLLVPEFAQEIAAGRRRRTEHIATKAIGATLLFSIGIAGIMMGYADGLGMAIYKSTEAGFYIRLLGALVPIMYLDGVVDGMLKGMGYQFYSMVVNIIDALLSLVMVLVLVPRMGVYGYIITIFVAEILNYSLSIVKLLVHLQIDLRLVARVVKPILAIIGATTVCHILGSIFPINIWLQMSLCLVVYVIFLLCTFALTHSDIRWFSGIVSKGRMPAFYRKRTRVYHIFY